MNAGTNLTAAVAAQSCGGLGLSSLAGRGSGGPAESQGLFSGQDEDDVHKCGRCQAEFTSLEEFVQHKIQKLCQRVQESVTLSTASLLSEEQVVPSLEESLTVAHILVEPSSLSEELSSGPELDQQYSKDESASEDQSKELNEGSSEGQDILQELEAEGSTDLLSVKLVVNEGGRYVCQLCQKTFKTASILKAHMVTHSTRKDYECKLCGTAFRTKGSLIRHNRRHTDERPYKCKKCGKSFRESGALTRHLKSLTPCTEKIRFGINKEIVVSKEVLPAGSSESNTDTVASLIRESIEGSPVISLVTDAKGNVLHEVHVQMQELPLQPKPVAHEMSEAGELQAEVELNENLLRQAMKNSGIVIETVTMEDLQKCEDSCFTASEEVENQDVEAEGTSCTEMDLELLDGKSPKEDETYICSHCNQAFCGAASLRIHVKGHLGYKLYKCEVCGKEFMKGYLLKKHQEVHFNERRYKCGECGKLYKTIAHVKGHMRVHSDERPYACAKCGKRYKTKNAQQVHFRTHLEEKPYVCQFCSRGFREKGSLVRHIRHHTGEKPFRCYKCGRGFAEHGTLNRHLRTKGGCLLALKEAEEGSLVEEEEQTESVEATLLSEDPHTVLVEFSSVVADTQEYIIEAAAEDSETNEAAELLEGARDEVDSHIMKVVQQIVNRANCGHQILVQNVTVAENAHVTTDATDTITIATPESLTEQVALTLASAIGEGAVLTTEDTLGGEQEATLTMVASEDLEMIDHAREFVIASQEGELEVQTVIV
ncbi:transcription factor E4F1 isoform X2 [Microcaecilia unicolor]|uniref:Transcription factor E4F1 n=1 Tax=Microcaecilia unicolor TaxID=1415580 RepID=A0A6P7YY66_9AMPH|nr:transcription factor E4F1 isoform X2 [Microcaecilia unicolor]